MELSSRNTEVVLSSTDRKQSPFPFVRSLESLQEAHGEGADRYIAAPLGRALGLANFGVNHETIFPGGRSSAPHAHSKDEEFVYVLSGTPTVWIDGQVEELSPGDSVAFPAGTGIAHTFINDSSEAIELLIVGEHNPDDRVFYPLNPERPHPRLWSDAPDRPLGPHNGEARAT